MQAAAVPGPLGEASLVLSHQCLLLGHLGCSYAPNKGNTLSTVSFFDFKEIQLISVM